LSSRRLLDRANQRNPLPEGTLAVGAGLVVSGIAIYGFLSIAKHALGEDQFAPLSLLWFITFILAPGFFLPVEQEVGRALAHRRALGQGGLPVLRKAGALTVILLVVITAVMAATSPILVHQVFDGDWALMGGLILAFACYSVTHFTRGVWSGTGRFTAYARLMGTEGVLRLVGCAAIAAVGIEGVGWYGLLVGIPAIIASLVSTRGQHQVVSPGPEASWGEITPNLGWLLAGSVFAAALVNAGPLAAQVLKHQGEDRLVSQLSTGVILARVPLFLFQAVQAALLPKLARLAAMGAYDEFKRGFRKLMLVVLAVGVIAVIGSFIAGPFATKVLFPPEIGRRTVTLLAVASAIYMGALALAQATIALHGHAKVALGWFLGLAAFVAVTAIPQDDLLLRVELGLVAGSVASCVALAFALRLLLRTGARPDEESLLEALEGGLPLET
jgi:O-antigen/teichoic acid export membrane protein